MRFYALLLAILISCSDRPSHEKFPGPPGRTTDQARAQNSQVVLGGGESQGGKVIEQKSIQGIAKLASGITVPKNDFIVYISARPIAGGAPLAVRRMKVEKFPFRFELTEANTMMEGTQFEGLVVVTIRLDQLDADGRSDPLSRLPGDVFGEVKAQIGQGDLELILDKSI